MTLVDTNILLDLVTNDPSWADWSQRQLEAAAVRGPLLINDVVYAELSVGFLRVEEVPAPTVIGVVALTAQIDRPDGEPCGGEVAGERTEIRRGAAQAVEAKDVLPGFGVGCLPDQPGEGRAVVAVPDKMPRSAGEVFESYLAFFRHRHGV